MNCPCLLRNCSAPTRIDISASSPPCRATSCAISSISSGVVVEAFNIFFPFNALFVASSKRTLRTPAPSESTRMAASAASIASTGVPTAFAPNATSDSVFVIVLLYTIVSCPAFINPSAKPAPIKPVPNIAIFIIKKLIVSKYIHCFNS
jgi:hypothetical protein